LSEKNGSGSRACKSADNQAFCLFPDVRLWDFVSRMRNILMACNDWKGIVSILKSGFAFPFSGCDKFLFHELLYDFLQSS
jgi:hypothetical protein